MSVLKFFWLRHAPPINPDRICYGADMAVDLSDRAGLERQAARLPAGALWVASPLPRTMDTARALAAQRAGAEKDTAGITPRDGLREQSFGTWVGRKLAELSLEPDFQTYMRNPCAVAPPGGESMRQFQTRVQRDIRAMVAACPDGGNVVIVAHAGTIRIAAAMAAGVRLADVFRLRVDPLSLTIVEYDHGKKASGKSPWALDALNVNP